MSITEQFARCALLASWVIWLANVYALFLLKRRYGTELWPSTLFFFVLSTFAVAVLTFVNLGLWLT